MSYYRTCPHCGAHLDPGEVCDCQIGPLVNARHPRKLKLAPVDKKTAPSAANAEDGRAEQTLTGPDSASYDIES